MNILIGGASGFVGRALVDHLETAGLQVTRLSRRGQSENLRIIPWNPATGKLTLPADTHFDAVIHLGGANIAAGRWTKRRKQELRDSRVLSTDLLARAIAKLPSPPKVFACASAIGIYGNRGDEILNEESTFANDFLGQLALDWEGACKPAKAAGIRTVHLRFGLILDPRGGALAKMLIPFKLGLGGRVGNGRQFMSWISLRDTVRAIAFCLSEDRLSGPVNIVAPNPVTNREFTRALGRAIHRPAVLPLPAFAARVLFGEMADATLLASARVLPDKLLRSGFSFDHTTVSACFADF